MEEKREKEWKIIMHTWHGMRWDEGKKEKQIHDQANKRTPTLNKIITAEGKKN